MPCIVYQERRFNRSSHAIIEFANEVIASYQAQGLTLTLRQLYYRFIAADQFPNSEQSYSRLGSIINDARLAGLVDWDAIEDRGRELLAVTCWASPAEIVQAAARSFRLDKWATQACRVEVWVEKQALESIVDRAAREFDVPTFACKGYTSQSAMWRAAQRFMAYRKAGQRSVIIHLGDHDPSGIDMTRDITDRLNDTFGVRVEVQRIALNMDQIDYYDPPPNPAKLSDSRARQYVEQHGDSSWELDALEPKVLHDLIQEHIAQRVDLARFKESARAEGRGRFALEMVADHMPKLQAALSKDAAAHRGGKPAKKSAAKKRGK